MEPLFGRSERAGERYVAGAPDGDVRSASTFATRARIVADFPTGADTGVENVMY
jgi:hypothetical protein